VFCLEIPLFPSDDYSTRSFLTAFSPSLVENPRDVKAWALDQGKDPCFELNDCPSSIQSYSGLLYWCRGKASPLPVSSIGRSNFFTMVLFFFPSATQEYRVETASSFF